MANVLLHGYVTVRCDCGWYIEDVIRPVKGDKRVECVQCEKVYIVHPMVLEEVAK